MNDILEFIEHFKGSEGVFLHGCCWWFAYILKQRFPRAHIKHEPVTGHFITEIDGRYYDIRGEVTDVYEGMDMEDMDDLLLHNWHRYKRLLAYCKYFRSDEDEL